MNSTLLNQLTGKAHRVRHREDSPARHYQDAIVYFLGNNVIYGLGVCLQGGTIITHKEVLMQSVEPYPIYLPNKNRRAYAKLITEEDDIALLFVRNFHYFLKISTCNNK